MGATSRIERIRERVSESEVTKKVATRGKNLVEGAKEASGFIAWSVGRVFRPVARKVKEAYEEYRDEHEMKEE